MKSIKIFFYLHILLLGIIVFTSCDNMLDVDIRSEISGSSYWKSETDFEPYLYGIYGRFRSHWDDFAYSEDRSDMWKPGYNNRLSSFWQQDITPVKTRTWTAYYGTIGHCNFLLSNLESFKFSNTDLKNQLKAETLALRAAVYFYIAKIWGDVPLLTNPIVDEKEPLHPRTPVKEIFKQINADIQTSLALFKDANFTDRYRFSKPAVYALLADVKMWEATVLNGGDACLQEAINAIGEIEKSDVLLLEDYGSIFDVKKNKEIILSIYLERSEYTSEGYNACLLRLDTSGAADNVDDLPIARYGQQGYCVSDQGLEILKKYESNGDKRISRTCIPEIYEGKILNWWGNKFRGTKYSDDRVADSDEIVYRLSGMLLLKAEAYALLDDATNSLTYLNKVRERAGIPLFEETEKTALLKEILDERGRELFHEMKRFWDLRRADAVGTIDIYQYIPNLQGLKTPLYWAVHYDMMILNDQLVQTEGYEN